MRKKNSNVKLTCTPLQSFLNDHCMTETGPEMHNILIIQDSNVVTTKRLRPALSGQIKSHSLFKAFNIG